MQRTRVIGTVLVCICAPLLYVGITQPLVHFEVTVKILGQHVKVMERDRALMGGKKDGVWVGLVNALWDEEAYFAAGLLFTFGVVIPITKLAFFAVWLSDLAGTQISELLLRYGRAISKWAAVDAVCEALLIGILMKAGPIYAYHDIAFPCFVAYCILSSIAFTCLTGEQQVDDPEPNWAHKILASRMQSPRRRVYVLVMSLTMFLILLGVAGSLHVVRIWMPKETMAKSIDEQIGQNPVFAPLAVNPALRRQLEQQLAAIAPIDVNASLSGAMGRLFSSGHWKTFVGCFFLACSTIFAPVMYAVLSVCKAITMSDLSDEQKQQLVEGNSDVHDVLWWPELESVRAFAHDLSMLDVMLVGVLLGHLAMDGEPDMKSQLFPGFAVLFFATLTWHFHKLLCRAAQISEHAGREEPGAEPSAEPIHGGTY